jgi:ribosomal protein L11 methyltransferase
MSWIQTHLTVDKSQAPLIELLLENLGALSTTLGDAGDEPMLEPAPGETPLWSATRVTGLFSGDTDPDSLRAAFNQALAQDISRHLVVERLKDEDWERSWLDQFKPMRFGQRLWICPSGHRVDEPDAVVIDLDPGLAFGTGTHPTTELCLRWLDSADLAGKTVIDFGCGSGVLAVAALKLGAAQAVGIDHDPQAIIASRENAKRNGVAERLELHLNEEFSPEPADIVLANILANVLVELKDQLAPLVTPAGELVLSGILKEQADTVTQAYAGKLEFLPSKHKDGWVLLHARHHGEARQ